MTDEAALTHSWVCNDVHVDVRHSKIELRFSRTFRRWHSWSRQQQSLATYNSKSISVDQIRFWPTFPNRECSTRTTRFAEDAKRHHSDTGDVKLWILTSRNQRSSDKLLLWNLSKDNFTFCTVSLFWISRLQNWADPQVVTVWKRPGGVMIYPVFRLGNTQQTNFRVKKSCSIEGFQEVDLCCWRWKKLCHISKVKNKKRKEKKTMNTVILEILERHLIS